MISPIEPACLPLASGCGEAHSIMGNLRLRISDFLSFELVFVLFLFAGAYKATPVVSTLDSYVDITVLTTAVGTLAGLLTLRRGARRPDEFQLVFAGTYAMLVLLAALSCLLVADDDPGALLKLKKFLVFNTYAVCVPLFIINTPQRVGRLLRLILTFAILAAVQALIGSRTAEDVRFVGAFGTDHYHALGISAGIALVIVCADILVERRGFEQLLLAGLAAIAIFAIFLSSTRQALVGLVPALPVLLPLWRQNRLPLQSLGRLLAVAGCSVLLFFVLREYIFADTDLGHIWTRMLALFDRDSTDLIVDSQRPELWADGLQLWLAYPVFGAGFGGYPILGQTGIRHPHNFFVELLAELGVVGLFVGTLLVAFAVKRILQDYNSKPSWSLTAAHAVWVFLFSCAMLSGDLTDNRLMFAFMALCLVRGTPAKNTATASRSAFMGSNRIAWHHRPIHSAIGQGPQPGKVVKGSCTLTQSVAVRPSTRSG